MFLFYYSSEVSRLQPTELLSATHCNLLQAQRIIPTQVKMLDATMKNEGVVGQ